jgi:hypothetical protein
VARRRKTQPSKSQQLKAAHEKHEAWLKQMGVGRVKLPTNKQGKRTGLNELPDLSDHQGHQQLSNRVAGSASARERQEYTGTYIKGLVTTHKSNIQPVTSREQMIDGAKMRR